MDTGWNCTLLIPLGLTRTGRAPLSLVVEPVLNDDLHPCLSHLSRALIAIPDWAVSAAGGPRTQPAQQLLGIRHADAVVNVEHGQPFAAGRIARRGAALGSHPMTMPDIARLRHRQLSTPSSKSVAITSLPSLTHTCR